MPETIPPTDSKTTKPSKASAHAPAMPGKWQRLAISARRWMRETFSREQLASGLKQLAWVAPLTLLIWVYAEQEQQITRVVRFPVETHTSNSNMIVRLSDPSDGYVSAELLGPRARLEQLSNELSARSVRFEVDPNLKEGTRQIPLPSLIKGDARFDGVLMKSSQPPLVSVIVNAVEEVIVPVEIRDEDKSRFEQVVFNPPTVKVRMSKTALDLVGRQITAHADLTPIARQSSGPKSNVPGVRVILEKTNPEDVSKIEPETVSVSAVVREVDKSHPIDTLPLDVSGATKTLTGLKITQEKYSLFNVVVTGPAEAIAEIEKNVAANVKAYFTVVSSDVGAESLQKEVWFVLPAGVKVKSVDGVPILPGKPPTVEVKVEKGLEETSGL